MAGMTDAVGENARAKAGRQREAAVILRLNGALVTTEILAAKFVPIVIIG
jgi:hypothetical protein